MEVRSPLQYSYFFEQPNNIWCVCAGFFKKHELLTVFLAAFIIRLIFWRLLGTIFSIIGADAIEYYITSINFQPNRFFQLTWGYENWYLRTPAYVVFLHIIHRELIIQVFLSSIGCVLMYRLNKIAGLLWIIYLQEIVYSFQYNKESLLLFFIISAIYLFRNNRRWLFVVILVILSGFVSYGGVISSNHEYSKGLMLNFWHLWQPSFNISIAYSKIFVYIQALPYTVAMFYFIRHTKLINLTTELFCLISVVYSLIYSEPRYREPFMPFLFLFIAPPVENFVNKIKSVKGLKSKMSLLKLLAKKSIRNQSSSELIRLFGFFRAKALQMKLFLALRYERLIYCDWANSPERKRKKKIKISATKFFGQQNV